MLVGLSRRAVSAISALLFLLTVILSTVIMFILFLSEINVNECRFCFNFSLPIELLEKRIAKFQKKDSKALAT